MPGEKPEDRWPSANDLNQYLADPKGPAQKKYKKLVKHFSAKQVITISIISAVASAAIAVLVSVAPITPYIQGLIAPKPWYKLAQDAQAQASLDQRIISMHERNSPRQLPKQRRVAQLILKWSRCIRTLQDF